MCESHYYNVINIQKAIAIGQFWFFVIQGEEKLSLCVVVYEGGNLADRVQLER